MVAFAQKNAALLGFAAANPTLVAQATKYSAQLTALGAVPKSVLAVAQAHGAAVTSAAKSSPGQWKVWYWICVAACVFFLGCIPLLRGRWSPARAKTDEEAHEALIREKMAELGVS